MYVHHDAHQLILQLDPKTTAAALPIPPTVLFKRKPKTDQAFDHTYYLPFEALQNATPLLRDVDEYLEKGSTHPFKRHLKYGHCLIIQDYAKNRYVGFGEYEGDDGSGKRVKGTGINLSVAAYRLFRREHQTLLTFIDRPHAVDALAPPFMEAGAEAEAAKRHISPSEVFDNQPLPADMYVFHDAHQLVLQLDPKTTATASTIPPTVVFARKPKTGQTFNHTYYLPAEALENVASVLRDVDEYLEKGSTHPFKRHLKYGHCLIIQDYAKNRYVGFGQYEGDDGSGKRVKGAGINLSVAAYRLFRREHQTLLKFIDSPAEVDALASPAMEARAEAEAAKRQAAKRPASPAAEDFVLKRPKGDTEDRPHNKYYVWQWENAQGIVMRQSATCFVSETLCRQEAERTREEEMAEGEDLTLVINEQLHEKAPTLPSKCKYYNWAWLGKEGSEEEAKYFFLTYRGCYKDAMRKNAGDTLKDPVLYIRDTERPFPQAEEIVRLCMCRVLREVMLNKARDMCMGCVYNSCGQVAHMDGCLAELDDVVEERFDRAIDSTPVDAFRKVTDKVMKALNCTPQLLWDMIRTYKYKVDRVQWIRWLLQSQEDICPIRRLIWEMEE